MSKNKNKAATEAQLAALHLAITEYFVWLMKDARDNELSLAPTDVSNILKFLKDNNITAMPDDETMQTLNKEFSDTLDNKRDSHRLSIIDSIRALENGANDDPLQGVV